MRFFFVLVVLSISVAGSASAAESGARAVLDRGMATYKSSGASAGLKALTKNGPLAGEKTLAGVVNNLRTVEDAFGTFEGYDVIREQTITPRVRMIFFVLYYAKSIAYGRFTGYQLSSGEWVANGFTFNTDPSELIPSVVIFKGQ